MSEVAAETQVDGSKDDASPGKLKNLKDVDEEEQEMDSSNEQEDEDEEPTVKKPKVAQENSVNESKTTNDHGKEESDGSRSTPRRGSKGGSKRLNTMSKIAKESEALLKEMGHKDENPDSERRRTRSQTRGTPPVTAKKTPRQESSSKRSRRGRPRKEEKDEEKEEKKESEKEDEDTAEAVNNADADDKEAGENTTSEGTGEEEESQPETENEPADEKN